MLGTFIGVLDSTAVTAALPNIAGNMAAANQEAGWTLTSYLIANAIVLPASGWFSLCFGRKRLLPACMALFTFASFMCGISSVITQNRPLMVT